MPFKDRAEAGRALESQLAAMNWAEPPVVIAIVPGAVPIAYEIARGLHAELDFQEVRPFSARARPDRELGLVASGGIRVVHALTQADLGLSDEAVAEAAARVAGEIHTREHHWRRRHPRPALGGRTVVLVADVAGPDARLDGAVLVARASGAARVLVAVPAGFRENLDQLRADADGLVCLSEVTDTSGLFGGPVLSDADVERLLERAEEWRAPVPV